MPIDLIAILKSVSGISGSIKAGKDLINSITGKGNDDEKLIAQTKKNIEETAILLEKISESGWSLNDYHELYDVSFRLNMQGKTLNFILGNISPKPSQDELNFIKKSIEATYESLQHEFTMGLSTLLMKAKYLDQRDQGMIEFTNQKLRKSFGGADALLQQSAIDYTNLKNYIRDITTASDDLVSIANTKMEAITTTLIKLGK